VQWDLRRLTGHGAGSHPDRLVRGDVYNSDKRATTTPSYRGTEGWQTRGIATVAVDVKWPFVGEEFLAARRSSSRASNSSPAPLIRNLAVPNEDARAIDLEDSNLFALNRFPGYDRSRTAVRLTWGVDWEFERPGWRIKPTIGQSYRLTAKPSLLPRRHRPVERVSDFVGRTEVRFRDLVNLTHRFRLDKDNFAVRRNEIDATIGSRRTYIEVGYLRLNRDIATVEDLQGPRGTARCGRICHRAQLVGVRFGRVQPDRPPRKTRCSCPTGSSRSARGWGIAYQDDCIEFGATWRRDFIDAGDARRGNAFQLFFRAAQSGFR
jgi:LPS-assembly protein